LSSIVKGVSSGLVYKQRFLISKGDALIPVPTSGIAYIYTEDKAVMIKTIEGKSYFINYSLDELEAQLDPKDFFRLNRQFITSINAIAKISQYFNGKLKIELTPTQEGEVIVSRAKTPVFKNWLEQ
jgi:DNA-binding LytR/AlgR family response regulator